MKITQLPLLALSAFLSCLIFSGPANAKAFSDITEKHQNFNAINYLSSKGIINGYGDETFRPDREITRAELIKIILTGKKIPIKKSLNNCFPDVGYLEWYGDYVCTAKKANLIKGYDDGTFKPEQLINKVEALKIIAETYQWKNGTKDTKKYFKDTPADSWYINYVLYGLKKNLFQEFDVTNPGLNSQQFEPGKLITRGEIAEILYRYLVMTELKKNSFSRDLEKIILPKTAMETPSQKNSDEKLPILAYGEIKIVLSWEIPEKTEAEKMSKNKAAEPKTDFDSHLIEPTDEEIAFSHKLDSKLETILEIGENKETISILKLKRGVHETPEVKDPGNENIQTKKYLYFVNNFSGNQNFAAARAKVEIYDQNGLAKTFYGYKNPGKIWKLFELDENYELTVFNSIGGCELIDRNSSVCPMIPEN